MKIQIIGLGLIGGSLCKTIRKRTDHIVLGMDLDELPMTELYALIAQTPGLLRRPIILDDKRLQIGYNEDEIRRFLPRKVRAMELAEAQRRANMV